MKNEELIEIIQANNGRITPLKKAIAEMFTNHSCVFSLAELNQFLESKNIKANRSSVFRELQFFCTIPRISKNTILGTDYYELQHEHHHHAFCTKCHIITPIFSPLCQHENIPHFTTSYHQVTWYGVCQNCSS